MPPPVLRTHSPGDAPRTLASGPRSVFRLFRGCNYLLYRGEATSKVFLFFLFSFLSFAFDLNSGNTGCAREWPFVLVVLVRRHRCAFGAAVRRALDDVVPGAVEEETGPAAVRCVPPGLQVALSVHALGALGIVVVV